MKGGSKMIDQGEIEDEEKQVYKHQKQPKHNHKKIDKSSSGSSSSSSSIINDNNNDDDNDDNDDDDDYKKNNLAGAGGLNFAIRDLDRTFSIDDDSDDD
jgi:hypothetical protein